EQLHAAGEVDALRRAHADYFRAFAEQIREDLFSPRQLDAMRRARSENANTQAAIACLTDRARGGDSEALEQGLLLRGRLDVHWHITAMHFTARDHLDPLLALAADHPPSRGRAFAWVAAGMVATTTGEWERSRDEWARGLADGKAVGDAKAAAEGAMG